MLIKILYVNLTPSINIKAITTFYDLVDLGISCEIFYFLINFFPPPPPPLLPWVRPCWSIFNTSCRIDTILLWIPIAYSESVILFLGRAFLSWYRTKYLKISNKNKSPELCYTFLTSKLYLHKFHHVSSLWWETWGN